MKRLKRNPYLRFACGYWKKAPTEVPFTQTKERIDIYEFRINEAWLASASCQHRHSVHEPLLDRVLGEDLEVEILTGESGFESRRVFDALETRRMAPNLYRTFLEVEYPFSPHFTQ